MGLDKILHDALPADGRKLGSCRRPSLFCSRSDNKRSMPATRGMTAFVLPDETFRLFITLELHKAQRLQYCMSIVFLTPGVAARTLGPLFVKRLAKRIASYLRATDIIATLRGSMIGIVLVDAEGSMVPRILTRVKEGLDGEPIARGGLTWSAGGSHFPKTASRVKELIEHAIDLMRKARKDGGDRLYLPDELVGSV